VLPALLENVSFYNEKNAFHTPVTSPSPFLSSSQTPPKAVFGRNICYVIFLFKPLSNPVLYPALLPPLETLQWWKLEKQMTEGMLLLPSQVSLRIIGIKKKIVNC